MRLIILGLLCLTLAACAAKTGQPPPPNIECVTQPKPDATDGGLGGTGVLSDGDCVSPNSG